MNPNDSENLLQRLSDAIDQPGGIPPALLAEAQADPEAREFLAFWAGDSARTLEEPLPPCGIALRDSIFKLANPRSADDQPDMPDLRHASTPARRQPWFSAAAAAAIVIGCGWLLYQNPASPGNAAAAYEVTPQEIAAIESDIDDGLANVAKPLSAIRMTLAKLETE